MQDEVSKVIPKSEVIQAFMEYTDGTEICPRFRLLSFLAGIGALLERNVCFQRSTHNLLPKLYPNIWVVLVAPQGRGHKSTSLSIVRKILEKVKNPPKILASKITPEALIKALSSPTISLNNQIMKGIDPSLINLVKRKAVGLLFSSELGVLLGKEKYNQGMIALLTDLYDCPDEWYSETIMRGDQRLYDVCLSIMGASTPDWLQSMLPPDAFRGGFMSRLILVGYPEFWYKRVPDPPQPDEQIYNFIISELNEIREIKGQVVWDKEAKEFFEDWYRSLKEPEPSPEAAYLERKQDHLLKIAIIIQITKDKSLTITRESIVESFNILNAIEKDTLRMIRYITVEPKMRIVQRFTELFNVREEISEEELLNDTWGSLTSLREYNEIVELLLKMKKIKIIMKGNKISYKVNKEDV